MSRLAAVFRGALAGVVGLLMWGCQHAAAPAPQPAVINQGGQGSAQVVQNPNLPTMEFNDLDACAGRLHDIEGQLLSYYVQKHHWPDNLQELRAFADPGEQTDYTCPVSHQQYIYVKGGLVKPGDPRRLMVYDATPAHKGLRYGIVVIYPDGRQAMHTTVIGIPEQFMSSYQPAPAIQPATRPVLVP